MDYHAILDTITDAEQAAESHAYLYSPIALEAVRARHKRARAQLIALLERIRAVEDGGSNVQGK